MTKIDTQIIAVLHPSVNEQEYCLESLELYCEMALYYSDLLPEKWQSEGVKILEGSACFKDWFLMSVYRNNNSLLDIFLGDGFPPQSLHQWYQWQVFYFQETGIFPPKIVLQAAVNEWLHRVSKLRQNEAVNQLNAQLSERCCDATAHESPNNQPYPPDYPPKKKSLGAATNNSTEDILNF